MNLTNEKLQQFFSQHMVVIEQEEYRREEITWQKVDFDKDMQLFEKPSSVFERLDKEAVRPRESDFSFQNKLFDEILNFDESTDIFEVRHYAGTVSRKLSIRKKKRRYFIIYYFCS